MKTILIFFLALCSCAFAYTGPVDGVYTSTGTSGDVQAAIDAALDTNVVEVPTGSHSWTSAVTLAKGVHLRGAGSGRVKAWGAGAVTFGTGAKSFVVQYGASIPNGTTLRAWQLTTDKDASYMLGTVTSILDPIQDVGEAATNYGISFKFGAGTEFITGGSLSAPLYYSGWVGHKFTVGGSPITVTDLGRMFLTGNTGTHTIKLQNSDGTDVAGGSVSLSMAGGVSDTFKYATLAAPVILSAGETYYVMSLEDKLGDAFYNVQTSVTTAAGATLLTRSYTRTELTLNATSNTGSGTKSLWLLGTEHVTKVTHNAGNTALMVLTEDVDASAEVSGIQFTNGASSGVDGRFASFNYTASGKPILVHNCWFNQSHASPADMLRFISTTRGVLWNISATWTFPSTSSQQFFHAPINPRTESWTTTSTMGMADIDGNRNIYFEDSDVHGNASGGTDFDANARIVWRYNVNNHALLNSHGYDTGPFGLRHWEIYNNQFIFSSVGADTLGLVNHILLRGGTGVITDNYFEDINSTEWGQKQEIQFGIWNLGRWIDGGGYSGNDGGIVEYPSPRQIGFGFVTGLGVDGQGVAIRQGIPVGESEPIYLWNNKGFAPVISITTDGTPGVENQYGVTPDDPNSYFQAGRDYFNNGTAKPGYVKFTYPHPLRGEGGGGTGTGNRKVRGRTSVGALRGLR